MKKIFIVANWKSNKTESKVIQWLERFKINDLRLMSKEIVVCPPFTLLPILKSYILNHHSPMKLGAQNISPFDEGAYTGEVSARQIKEFADYAIIGHSERKKYFHETEDDIIAKLKKLIENNITPILCVSDMKQMDYYLTHGKVISDNAKDIIFVYEPPGAISRGGAYRPESPEDANRNAAEISSKIGKRVVTLYGGSVNPGNIASLCSQESIDGGLVGQASLDAKEFYKIIQNA